jgi:deazaflavin-dependent oxidoreductase (nitroreductase family)
MSTAEAVAPERDPLVAEEVEEDLGAVPWWLFLLTGIGWLWFAFVVLSFDFRTVWAVAIFAGVSFLFAGVNEFVAASMVRDWRWAHVLLGVLCIGAGVVALAWPDITFLALAAVVGWFLLFMGTFDLITSLVYRHDYWWLQIAVGVLEIALGVWAITYPTVSFVLLAVWIAGAAIFRGVGQIVLAIALRDRRKRSADRGERAGAGTMARDGGNGRSPSGSGNGNGTGDGESPAFNEWNRGVIDEFRRNHGQVSGDFEGQPLLLLHSTGARTGEERVNPLMYQEEGDSIVVFASKAGAPTNPDWYHNLLHNPHATIELGDEVIDVDARAAGPAERERLWARQVQNTPGFAEYEQKTDRTIPVVVLERSR